MKYDYLIVGAGLFGATFAYFAHRAGKKCLVIDKRPHIGGNVYTRSVEGIQVHQYGAHIFHTSQLKVWNFVTSLVDFNRFTNTPIANYKGKLYNLPFNMNTFYQMWGVTTPEQAMLKIEQQRKDSGILVPKNLEEQAISLIGNDIYFTLIKDYTEKQWGRKATELPAFIIKRLPVRFTFDNNYFNDCFQGIPIGGYTLLVQRMLEGVDLKLNTDYLLDKDYWNSIANHIIYTGEIDRFFNYSCGYLKYRTLRFETEILKGISNYQGNAVVNFTDADTPYTRIIEHKHFDFGNQPDTVISREYSAEWKPGDEPYYPVNDEQNSNIYAQYKIMADSQSKVTFGGRLGEYQYYDMHQVIENAMHLAEVLLSR